MKLALVYFSATGNTAKIAKILRDEFTQNQYKVVEFDITSFSDRKSVSFKHFDFVIFGFPVYGSFAPRIIIDWVRTLKEESKICAQYFTYGGPTIGVAHYTTKELLNQQGFKVLASGEFLGKHTYNVGNGFNLMEGHPNEDDVRIARNFAKAIIIKLAQRNFAEIYIEKPENLDVLLERRKESSTQPRRPSMILPPSRKGKTCRMCLDCEKLCPVQAFNAELGEANEELCIKCMRCLTICPDNIIAINDLTELFKRFNERMDLSDATLALKSSKYFI